MAWTAPMTAVAGTLFPAADFNTFVRDNMAQTAPEKATTPGSIFAVTGENEIEERTPGAYTDFEKVSFTSAAFGDPDTGSPGPSVTVTSGVHAIVGYRAFLHVPSTAARVEASYAISGATTRAALGNRAVGYSTSNSADGLNLRAGGVDIASDLTPGVNTFTMKYSVSSSTGVAASRRIWVLPL